MRKFALSLFLGVFVLTLAPGIVFSATHTPKPTPTGIPGLSKKFFEKFAIGTGKVIAKSGTTLTVSKDFKNYTILTDDKTQFRRRFWGKGSYEEIQIGHDVSVIGRFTDDTKTTVLATLVKDLSVQARVGIYFGTVKSVSSDGFVITTIGRGDLAVTLNSATVLTNRTGQTINLSDVAVGQRVRVRGLWDKNAGTITQVTKVKDFSLPPLPSKSPTPTP